MIEDEKEKKGRLSLEWKTRIRITVLLIIFFGTIGVVTSVLYRITDGATTPEEIEAAREYIVPDGPLTE